MNFEIEHDACGIGTVVQIDGKQSYDVVDKALHIVEKLEHRAGKDASGKVGDGVGILLQISDDFFKLSIVFFRSGVFGAVPARTVARKHSKYKAFLYIGL